MIKKIILIFVMAVITLSCLYSLTLNDLNEIDKEAIIQLLIVEDEDINQWNVESLEGIDYTLLFENDDYVIINVNGTYVIYYK
jgi:hypothetical protein